MDCCLLSSEEVGRLLHYKIKPNHEEHIHIPVKEAMARIKLEEYELVTSWDGRNYCTPAKLHFIEARPSGPERIKVIQRIRSNYITEIRPPR